MVNWTDFHSSYLLFEIYLLLCSHNYALFLCDVFQIE